MLFQVLYHPSAHLNFMTTQQNNRARIAGVAIEYTGARLPEFKALSCLFPASDLGQRVDFSVPSIPPL